MLPPSFGLPEPPWVVAHRGASADEPENSLASIEAALAQRADMIEIDIQLTRDGELVLVHDWELEIDGRRRTVEESDRATLLGATRADGAGTAAPLATLGEALAAVADEVPLNIEIKRRRADPEMLCERFLSIVGDRTGLLISSFDWDLLALLRRARPAAPLAPIGDQRPHQVLRAAERIGAATIHCHRRLAFSDFISAARAGGWPVLVYTVNDPGLAGTLFDRGVGGIFTDRPGEMRLALELP